MRTFWLLSCVVETILAYGHPNVRSRHKTTIEVTKEPHLTIRGDCIIGVGAEKGCADLSDEFKAAARDPATIISVKFTVGDLEETVTGKGHPDLTFTHPTDMVIRKSDFTCSRTLMVGSDKSSAELSRKLINLLKDKNQELVVTIEAILPQGK